MFSFNFKGEYETPLLTLCTPMREELFVVSECKGLTYSPVFDSLSELEFEVSSVFTTGEEVPYYNLIKQKKPPRWWNQSVLRKADWKMD